MSQLMIATRKGLFRATESAGAWSVDTPKFLGDPVTYAFRDAGSGTWFAALNLGHFGVKLHRSESWDSDWEEVAAPAYPPFPEGREPDRCPMRGIEIPWSLQQIWVLTTGGSDRAGRLWAGTIPGGLFRSEDLGATWSLVDSLWDVPERAFWMGGGYDYPGIHSICVDPRDSNRIAVAISCGGVWLSEDAGATWTQGGQGLRSDYGPPDDLYNPVTQDAHLMAACAAAPETMWIQHHNGVFRSTDGGKTFSEIKEACPSVFGFAVAAHPEDPKTAWFVPAIKDEQRIPKDGKLVVTRTRDGGQSFDVLSNGLPEEPSYDLIYRHALVVDSSGERLAFGSTTGGLWVSADGGDSWTRVPGRLPPIYSVNWIE